jgi:transcriptional regulator with XRE-family HTH domain
MNQVEAATLLGVESDTLKKWERGKELPDDSYLPRIKKFLDRNLVGSDLSMKAYRK